MRVLLVAPPSRTRLRNLVPLTWAFRSAGHDVKVAGRSSFVDEILGIGCTALDVGLGDGTGLVESRVLGDFAKAWRVDLVVFDADAPAGTAAAKAVGAPSVRLLGALDENPGSGEADSTLDTVPPSLRASPAAGTRSVRHVPYFGPVEVPAWLRRKQRRSRVLLALTDIARLGSVLAIASEMDAELVCASEVDKIPRAVSVPANVTFVDFAPPASVLPTCTAVVHDGDAELALAAATHGLPQLSLTGSAFAARVAGAGAGIVGTAGRVPELMTGSELRAGALALRDEISALPTPRTVAAALTSMIVGSARGR